MFTASETPGQESAQQYKSLLIFNIFMAMTRLKDQPVFGNLLTWQVALFVGETFLLTFLTFRFGYLSKSRQHIFFVLKSSFRPSAEVFFKTLPSCRNG